MADKHTVSVPEHVYEACEGRIADTTFESVDEYVAYVLGQVVAAEPDQKQDDSQSGVDEQHLAALGYIDT